MTRRNGRRSFAAATEEVLTKDQAIEALKSGELDTDDLTEEELDELTEDLTEEEFEQVVANNPELVGDEDDDEDESDDDDEDEDDGLIVVDAEGNEVDVSDLDDEELAEAVESGEIDIVDAETGESVIDDEEDDDDDEDSDEEARGFAAYDDDYDDEDDEDDDEEEFYQGRAFSADDVSAAYRRGIEDAAEEAEEVAERTYISNRQAEIRAFALEEEMGENIDIVDELIEDGRLAPSHRDLVASILIGASSIQGETRSYAAADLGDYGEDTLRDLFIEFLGALPKNSLFAEEEAPGIENVRAFSADDFAEMHTGAPVSKEIDRAVRGIINTMAEEGNIISYRDALKSLKSASLGRR